MNYLELKNQYEVLFNKNNIDEKSDIDWIMVEITGKKRSMLQFHNFSIEEVEKIESAISQRIKHIPMAYIFGKSYFYGREFVVNENTLIPRLDTEILIETILEIVNRGEKSAEMLKILDIGTGSGAIAITLQSELNSSLTAVDISEKAILVASENAKRLGANVEFVLSDLFEKLQGKKYDIIVSNPPYIKSSVIEKLEPEVKENEPITALDGGNDGLKFYRKIVDSAKNYLKKDGMLFFEIGYDQAKEVMDLMKENFIEITVKKDYSGNDRVIFGKLRS